MAVVLSIAVPVNHGSSAIMAASATGVMPNWSSSPGGLRFVNPLSQRAQRSVQQVQEQHVLVLLDLRQHG
jgi:hypothetical protein